MMDDIILYINLTCLFATQVLFFRFFLMFVSFFAHLFDLKYMFNKNFG